MADGGGGPEVSNSVWYRLFEGEITDFTEIEDVYNIIMSSLCVLCAGLASGLTIGMLSIDRSQLDIKQISGTEQEKADAALVLPVIKRHHLLLCTLLLFNSIASESLPIFLGALLPNYMAVLLSVSLILVFGEIIPSAFFTGSRQLSMAAKMVPFVYGLLFFFWPVAFPISLLLDHCFGDHSEDDTMSRSDLEALVFIQSPRYRYQRLHSIDPTSSSTGNASSKNSESRGIEMMPGDTQSKGIASRHGSKEDGLSHYEVNIMTGILKLSQVSVRSTMIDIKDAFMLSDSTKLDEPTMQTILKSGFSRIPVFRLGDRGHILGYILVKTLIVVSASCNCSL
jgi:metal transporter CNNM